MRAAALGAAAALLCLGLPGCDRSQQRYERAHQKYEALIAARVRPTDPAYDEVLKALEEVPEGGAAHRKATELAAAIRALRSPLPHRPLAVERPAQQDALSRKRAECAELARGLGRAAEGDRERLKAELQACKQQIERLDVARIHAQDPLGPAGHAHGHLDEEPGEHGTDGG